MAFLLCPPLLPEEGPRCALAACGQGAGGVADVTREYERKTRGRRTVYTRAHAVYADAEVPRLDSPRGRVGVGGVERAEEFFQRDP